MWFKNFLKFTITN